MDALIGKIEKAKPFFEKVSRNKYLKAIRDGFMSAMPIESKNVWYISK